MPFDVLPQETKVGRFQRYADAMLRGCAVTKPSIRAMDGCYRMGDCCVKDAHGRIVQACAYYAMEVGLGCNMGTEREFNDLVGAYIHRYGTTLVRDYEFNGFTREQIAARIAAL